MNVLASIANFVGMLFKRNQLRVSTGFKKYHIAKGHHYCKESCFVSVELMSFTFKVLFDNSCVYTSTIKEDQEDENKLIGITDSGQFFPHKYSARFGWDYDIAENQICLSAYTYNIGIRAIQELCKVPLNTEVNCGLFIFPDKYVFMVNNQQWEMPRTSHTKFGRGILLFPYFGGNELPLNDIVIMIEITGVAS